MSHPTIYKITDLTNGKIYIGQTTTTIEKRFSQHLSRARNGYHMRLCKAIREHGENNFVIEAIATPVRRIYRQEIGYLNYEPYANGCAEEKAIVKQYSSDSPDIGYNFSETTLTAEERAAQCLRYSQERSKIYIETMGEDL